MTVDTTGIENLEFWARIEAEEHEREREIERQRELDRDGLGYVNPDANCGANDPADASTSQGVADARIDLWCEINELCRMYSGYTYGFHAIARQERAVGAAIDSLMEKCGHA